MDAWMDARKHTLTDGQLVNIVPPTHILVGRGIKMNVNKIQTAY